MSNFKITAGGIDLDVFEGLSLSVNKQIEDILNPSVRKADFTKTIELPSTPKNNKFFNSTFDANIDNFSFNINKSIEASIRVGEDEIISGGIQLLTILLNNKKVSYEVSIRGTVGSLIGSFEDHVLSQLDISKYNHTRDTNSVISSLSNNIFINGEAISVGENGKGYVYPYIINGNSNEIQGTMYLSDLSPAVFVKTIIDEMFSYVGKRYTSVFFNSEYFKKLIIPYTGDQIQKTSEQVFNQLVRVGAVDEYEDYSPVTTKGTGWWYNSDTNYLLPLLQESGTVDDVSGELEFTDILNQFSTVDQYEYTCQSNGYYDVAMDGKLFGKYTHSDGDDVSFKEGSFEYRYQLILFKVGGGSVILDSSYDPSDPTNVDGVLEFQPDDGTHATPWIDLQTPLPFSMGTENVFLSEGDRIRVRLGFKYPDSVEWYGVNDVRKKAQIVLKRSVDDAYSNFSVSLVDNESLGNDFIDMNQILPKGIKMKDFFLSISKMFNLIIAPNPNDINDLIIEPRDYYFESKKKTVDWTNILDNDKEVDIKPMSEVDARTYSFKYKDDQDFYNKSYTDETKRSYGDLNVNVVNDFSNKTNRTEILFSPTPCSDNFTSNRVAPYFVDFEDGKMKPKKVKYRILFYGGLVSSNPFTFKEDEGDTGTVLNTYGYCGMYDHPKFPTHDLGFGFTDKIYFNTNQIPFSNLYQQFHKNTLSNIINPNARLFTGYFKLTPKQIANFDWRDRILISGALYRAYKIQSYNPAGTDKATKVKLYKIVDVEPFSVHNTKGGTGTKLAPNNVALKDGVNGGMVFTLPDGGVITNDNCAVLGGTPSEGLCIFNGNIENVPQKGQIPTAINTNFNSINALGVTVQGSGNYVKEGTGPGVLIGSGNVTNTGVNAFLVLGENQTINESNVIKTNTWQINPDGNLISNGLVSIDGGKDIVMNPIKTNFIDLVDGGKDSVRNIGGDSKARIFIDGNTSY